MVWALAACCHSGRVAFRGADGHRCLSLAGLHHTSWQSAHCPTHPLTPHPHPDPPVLPHPVPHCLSANLASQIMFYVPVIFSSLGTGAEGALLNTVIIGAVNVVSTFVSILSGGGGGGVWVGGMWVGACEGLVGAVRGPVRQARCQALKHAVLGVHEALLNAWTVVGSTRHDLTTAEQRPPNSCMPHSAPRRRLQSTSLAAKIFGLFIEGGIQVGALAWLLGLLCRKGVGGL